MKKIAFLLLLAIFYKISAQPTDKEYKKCVKDFYKTLFDSLMSDKQFSEMFENSGFKTAREFVNRCKSAKYYRSKDTLFQCNEMKQNLKVKDDIIGTSYYYELTQGMSFELIEKIIDNTDIFQEDIPFVVNIEIKFPTKKIVTIEINGDAPPSVNRVWLNNGQLLSSALNKMNTGMYNRIGLIKSTTSYENIMSKPCSDSKIVGKMRTNEFFVYTSIGDSEWWPVFRYSDNRFLGYIRKNIIIKYRDFPKYQKEKLEKNPHC